MFRNPMHSFRRKSMRAIRVPALIWLPLVGLLGAGIGGWVGMQQAREQARTAATEHLALASIQVREQLDRYELFPDIASFCPCVREALVDPSNPRKIATANQRLADINTRIRADVSYVLNLDGDVIAASNADTADSFVGRNYAIRPYFRTALTGSTGRFVGIGMTSGKLGYYLARPVTAAGRTIGVIAVKLDLAELQQRLLTGGSHPRQARPGRRGSEVLIADTNGVVFISTERAWRFHTLAEPSAADRMRLQDTRAYATEPLPPLAIKVLAQIAPDTQLLSVPGSGHFIAVQQVLPSMQWRLLVLVRPTEFAQTAWLYTLLGLLAGLLAVTIALLLTLRELYQRRVLEAAIHDPLTGLFTRMYMNETLPRLIARHNQNPGEALGVAILDVDLFKQVNDRFGHLAGDRVLADLGAMIRAQSGDTDLAVRLGGEELAIFHVGTSPGTTLRLAERMRLLTQRQAVRWNDEEIRITISGGVAEHHVGETLVDLLQRADQALYRAKGTGRNQIIDAEPPTTGGLPPQLGFQITHPEPTGDSQ